MGKVEHFPVTKQNQIQNEIRSPVFLNSLESVTRSILLSETIKVHRYVSYLFVIHKQNNARQ